MRPLHGIQIVEHDLLKTPLTFERGSLAVPTAPGIGVELDCDAVAHYAEVFEKHGNFESYRPGFDAHKLPDQERRPVRDIFR